jgi:nitrite reductase (NADH) large subunit
MKIVVVGNGMVSHKFCEKLIRRSPKGFEIIVFGEELRPAYDRVHLSEYFAGKSGDDLQLASADWYSENEISLHLGDPVKSIDRSAKTIQSFKGVTQPYDILVMATGSAAMVPAIHGVGKKEFLFIVPSKIWT